MCDKPAFKKATVRLRCPNPLFEAWLREWQQEEHVKGNIDDIYTKALESLKKYPLVLKSGSECMILEHFDKELCLKLNKKLEQRKKTASEEMCAGAPEGNSSEERSKNMTEIVREIHSPRKSPKRKTKDYVPAKRSAAYGLLLALVTAESESSYPGWLSKEELVKRGQKYCDVPLRKPTVPGSFYTGWSSMSQLVGKGLVARSSHPPKFSLTEKGRDVCLRLQLVESGVERGRTCAGGSEASTSHPPLPAPPPLPNLSPLSSHQLVASYKPRGRRKKDVAPESSESGSSQSQEFEAEDMIFLPSGFQIILLVDTAETSGCGKRDEDPALLALRTTGVRFEVRHLKVGDYIWLARDSHGREMVLPYIVERKRLDDLGASIKDGRYHEQKSRILRCGLQNKMYLVEDTGVDRNGLPLSSIRQAISNTLVCDKFSVKWTDSLQESMKYLARLTQIIINIFKGKTLMSCRKSELSETLDLSDDIVSLLTFQEFSFNMGKLKVSRPREMFAKMLVQLSGLSGEKAWRITEHYPTPRLLIEGFVSGQAGSLLPGLTCGLFKRKLGSKIPALLETFYTSKNFPG